MSIPYSGRDCEAGSPTGACALTMHGPAERESEPIPPTTIRAAVFFDGTGNNRVNTRARTSHPMASRLLHLPFMGDSFDNANTNVEKLERYLQAANGADNLIKIYIEGIGTTNLGSDDIEGGGFGLGVTGVRSRVNQGFELLISRIEDLRIDTDSSLTIDIDVFGFSRGAAAARYFIYQVLEHENVIIATEEFYSTISMDGRTLRYRLEELHYTVSAINIKFAGLFDTVAAHGTDHSNDVEHLKQNYITRAAQVVHLAAADEHRLNFPLINIASNRGIEVFLPGVHSDIGGSYPNNFDESELEIFQLGNESTDSEREGKCIREKERLRSSGLYTDTELIFDYHGRYITANRNGIRNEYSRIPLRIMGSYAHENGLIFSGNLVRQNRIPSELAELNTHIQSYKSRYGSGSSIPEHWHDDTPWHPDTLPLLRSIRHDFLHNSSHYTPIAGIAGAPMQPQFFWNGYGDTYAHRFNGVRKRKIYEG